MKRLILMTAALAMIAVGSTQDASAGRFWGWSASLRYEYVQRAEEYCDCETSYIEYAAPWYVDRVDPLLEEQDWYSHY